MRRERKGEEREKDDEAREETGRAEGRSGLDTEEGGGGGGGLRGKREKGKKRGY